MVEKPRRLPRLSRRHTHASPGPRARLLRRLGTPSRVQVVTLRLEDGDIDHDRRSIGFNVAHGHGYFLGLRLPDHDGHGLRLGLRLRLPDHDGHGLYHRLRQSVVTGSKGAGPLELILCAPLVIVRRCLSGCF
ncbi:protein of unknown function [Thauera humireducens]|nr:protein of unknown function [Thauera humireducens]